MLAVEWTFVYENGFGRKLNPPPHHGRPDVPGSMLVDTTLDTTRGWPLYPIEKRGRGKRGNVRRNVEIVVAIVFLAGASFQKRIA